MMKIYGWISGVLGIWIAMTALLDLSATVIFWGDFVAGIILFGLSLHLTKSKLIGWLLLHLGLWLILIAWIPGFGSGELKTWSHALTGLVIVLLGLGSLIIPARFPAYELGDNNS